MLPVHPPEYVAARRVLLDALEALEPQISSVVLVGAQAIYVHTGDVPGTGVATTTDSDLALDVDLVCDDPEITNRLEEAGFVNSGQPGRWFGAGAVALDIMVAPFQAGTASRSARAAKLPPHEKSLARITGGLEPSLVDHAAHVITALDELDSRSASVNVAGPAALLVAKLVKIAERHDDVAAGKKSRLKNKDAVDCLRLLSETEPEDMLAGLQCHADAGTQAAQVSRDALGWLAEQHARGPESRLRSMISQDLSATEDARFDALVDELLRDCTKAALIPISP
ncbi:hypothetical protein [Cellulomonas sp.]|uniref:hypothetical protein n=1 Tax=Cellulomonas sp. TaxID=40001 RepID=UPI003BAA28A6